MTIQELQAVYRAQPFRPFSLHLADGRRIRVDHPEWMAHSPQARTMVVYQEDGSLEIIDLLLIVSIHHENRQD